MITLTWQTLITAAAIITAAATIFGRYNKLYDFVKRQERQDKLIQEIQEEQSLLVYGVWSCLKGLHEQGANGPVTDAINKIEKHLNEKAHGGSR